MEQVIKKAAGSDIIPIVPKGPGQWKPEKVFNKIQERGETPKDWLKLNQFSFFYLKRTTLSPVMNIEWSV